MSIGRRSFIFGSSAAVVAIASGIELSGKKPENHQVKEQISSIKNDIKINFDVDIDSLPNVKSPSIVVKGDNPPPKINMSDQDKRVLYKTIYAEARGEGEIGMKAVVHVIFNRVLSKDSFFAKDVTVSDTCLRGSQFSCWLKKIKMKIKMNMIDTESDEFKNIIQIVETAHDEYECGTDYSRDALFYVNKKIKMPKWVRTMNTTAVINNHIFFKPKEIITI